ncbi:reverse transcriptase domain-containing protein [Stenotrophomonas maltophilia]|uniref:reverse transcriptase domain-containing protein n=1 Tax=Stenotrophomonas maltophilia TaxID=40324 RepID=UPI000C14D2B5|nr:reverse transcriptase domain-containing protein [Stenotrophomonas maltophilia]
MDIDSLRLAYSYDSLGALFGIPGSALKTNLYKSRGYTSFTIPKKSGGVRAISAPGRLRKTLQRQLLPVLYDAYKMGPNVHGFARGRSVRTNAQPHAARNVVINFDLKDFFPSISFQRIRGVFLANPMRLDWSVANILAQMCSLDGVMPAGAPTSPVLSNIICAKLDKRLSALAARLGGSYTRYADDLTFSFDRPLAQLRSIAMLDEEGKAVVGASISEIVKSEGFSINMDKFRISVKGSRKTVTGLVVNEKVNVKRSWYLKLESTIYAMDKFGIPAVAAQVFPDEKIPAVASAKLLRQIHGKVSYLSMIRGKGDWLAADIAHRFNGLHGEAQLRVPSVELISQAGRRARGVHIVNASTEELLVFDLAASQGTAFTIPSGLMVTAAHVVEKDDTKTVLPHVYIMNERRKALAACDVLAVDWDRDIAILRVNDEKHRLDLERSRYKLGLDPAQGDHLVTVGYPDYTLGERATAVNSPVSRIFKSKAATHGAPDVNKARVDGPIQGGMSGGPALDSKFEVRGVIHKGVLNPGGVAEIIAVSEVRRVALTHGLKV